MYSIFPFQYQKSRPETDAEPRSIQNHRDLEAGKIDYARYVDFEESDHINYINPC